MHTVDTDNNPYSLRPKYRHGIEAHGSLTTTKAQQLSNLPLPIYSGPTHVAAVIPASLYPCAAVREQNPSGSDGPLNFPAAPDMRKRRKLQWSSTLQTCATCGHLMFMRRQENNGPLYNGDFAYQHETAGKPCPVPEDKRQSDRWYVGWCTCSVCVHAAYELHYEKPTPLRSKKRKCDDEAVGGVGAASSSSSSAAAAASSANTRSSSSAKRS